MQSQGNLMFNSKVKKIISLLFLTALILSSLSVFALPKVRAQDNQATVVSYSWYSAPGDSNFAANPGDLIVVGEIQNIGTNTLESAGVLGAVYDTNSSLLASTSVPVFGSFLLPGQKAPFYMEFTPDTSVSDDPDDQDWIPYIGNITVSAVGVIDYNQTGYSGLTIPSSSLSASSSSGVYTVTGTLTNSGNQIVSEPLVVATFYNASGTVIGVDFTDALADTLGPGATASFSVTPIDDTTQMTDAITNYTLLGQYTPYTGTAPTPTPVSQTSTPTASNEATPTPTSTQGTAHNKTSSVTLSEILVAVAVVVVLGVLVAVFMVRRRGKTEQFESPPPPPPPT
jgi:hypothetical protein